MSDRRVGDWPITPVGLLAAMIAAGSAIGAALLTGTEIGPLTGQIEQVSSTSGSALGDIADLLPLGYAFGAGMVAAVNPCGFAMLPAYLGLYLGTNNDVAFTNDKRGRSSQVIRVSVAISLGFIMLFGAAGIVIGIASSAVTGYLPWMGLVIGFLLVATGGWMLGGGGLYANVGHRIAGMMGPTARQNSLQGYFVYGVAYGLVSLSCTFPIFLTVVGGTLTTDRFLTAFGQFVLYGLGMGSIITTLTIATAIFKGTTVRRVQRWARYLQPISAALLLLAGAYIIYYWLTIGELLNDIL